MFERRDVDVACVAAPAKLNPLMLGCCCCCCCAGAIVDPAAGDEVVPPSSPVSVIAPTPEVLAGAICPTVFGAANRLGAGLAWPPGRLKEKPAVCCGAALVVACWELVLDPKLKPEPALCIGEAILVVAVFVLRLSGIAAAAAGAAAVPKENAPAAGAPVKYNCIIKNNRISKYIE